MNILLFVTSLLLILSLLTYARIDNFRYFLGMQSEFERYMTTLERAPINQAAKKWYETTIASNGKSSKDSSKPENKEDIPKPDSNPAANNNGPSSSHISIYSLIHPGDKEVDQQAFHQTVQWLKNLMQILYGQQPFFKELQASRPGFLDEILTAMAHAVQALPKDQQPKQVGELANLDLGPDLEQAFYYMLKGCLKEAPEAQNAIQPKSNSDEDKETSSDEEADNAIEALEYSAAEGYTSLLNYITLQNTNRVRIFLASRPVLLAIFGQPGIVESIIQTRHNLYKQVVAGMSPEDAAAQFKVSIQSMASTGSDAFLDFKVSKTNPRSYE